MQALFSTDKWTGSIWEMIKHTEHLTRSESEMASFFCMTNGTGPSWVKCFPISSASLYFKQAVCQGAGAHCCSPMPLTGLGNAAHLPAVRWPRVLVAHRVCKQAGLGSAQLCQEKRSEKTAEEAGFSVVPGF